MNNKTAMPLLSAYPSLYGQTHSRLPSFSFEFEDGWLPIMEALSKTLVERHQNGGMPSQIMQAKEKFGTLSVFANTDDFGQGAIDLAEAYSARICERIGYPGLPVNLNGWLKTLSPTLVDGDAKILDDAPGTIPSVTARIARIGSHAAMHKVRQSRQKVLGDTNSIPNGWAELIDCLAGILSKEGWRGDVRPCVLEGLYIDNDGRLYAKAQDYLDDEFQGAIAFAANMSSRIDTDIGSLED